MRLEKAPATEGRRYDGRWEQWERHGSKDPPLQMGVLIECGANGGGQGAGLAGAGLVCNV